MENQWISSGIAWEKLFYGLQSGFDGFFVMLLSSEQPGKGQISDIRIVSGAAKVGVADLVNEKAEVHGQES